MAEYVSGRRLNQQFGVSGVTENDTVINVIGRVAVGIDNTGIGTTTATANIDTSTIRIRDTVIDSSGYGGALGYFLTKDINGLTWTAVPPLNNNAIFVASDEDIIGVSSFTGLNFITNDNYYNIATNPINTNFADITVDLRWYRDRIGSGGIYTTTVVGIGSTIPRTSSDDLSDIKLDIIGDVSIEGNLYARKLIGDIDVITDDLFVSGVSTFIGISTFGTVGIGTTNVVDNDVLTIVGDAGLRGERDTFRVGNAITMSNGIVTATTFDGKFLDIEFLNVTGIGTINSGIITNLKVTGVSTFIGENDNILGNTNTGSVQIDGGVGIDKNVSIGGSLFVNTLVGIGTSTNLDENKLTVNGNVSVLENNVLKVGNAITMSGGIVTATKFDGQFLDIELLNVTGIGTINSGIITNLRVTGVSTFIGISTFGTVGIGTTNVVDNDVLTIVGDSRLGGERDTFRVGNAITMSNGIVTATKFDGQFLDIENLNVTGISTLGTVEISAGIITSTTGTAVTYFGNLTGTASTASFATTAFTLNDRVESEFNVAFAQTAGIATNLSGGGTGQIPYQTAPNVTGFLTTGGSNQVLTSNGVGQAPSWRNAAPSGAIEGITIEEDGGNATPGFGGSITTLNFTGTPVSISANAISGVATITIAQDVEGSNGIANTAVKLQTPRTFEITGDVVASPIAFDGTGNVSLAATIQPDSVGLGTDTFGDYVKDISGTANEIVVTGGTGEGSSPVISFATNPTIGGNVVIGNDLQINNNLNINGTITVGGTTAIVYAEEFRVADKDIVLGFTTDGSGNDVSTDTTANGGGIAIASTEGNPLVCLQCAGINTFPGTYKQFIWYKAGAFSGLNTDAWLSNYAIGIGSTQVPNGVRLAAGGVQFTDNDIIQVRNINSSGIITALQFIGTASTASFATTAFTLNDRVESEFNVATAVTSTNVVGGIGSLTSLNVSGIITGTLANDLTLDTSGIGLSGIATYNNSGVATFTVTSNATDANTNSTIVARDGSGNFSAGTITANLTGTATTATNLADGANITTGTINDDRLPDLITSNINISSGISSVATLDATNATIDNLTFTSGIAITSVDTDLTTVSASDDTLASAKAIKNYVDNQVGNVALDFAGDAGTGNIDLDSETFTIAGTANEIETIGAGNTLTIGLPGSVAISTSLTVGSAVTITSSGITVASGIITALQFIGTASTASFATTAFTLNGVVESDLNVAFAQTAGIATYTSEWTLGANGISDYTFTGPGFTGAENDPTLYLTRGEQYKFINNSGGHPFRIQSTPNGSVGTQYNDGITNNDAGDGTTLLWNVQFDSPDILYYQCTSHSSMGGKIYIVNAGIASDVNLFTTGISTLGTVKISAGIITSTTGTAVTYYGDGSNLTELTGASAATYGDASTVAQIEVDANGRITNITEVAISGGGGGATDKIEEGNTKAEVIDTGSDGRFIVETEGVERLRINSIGNLGIGTDDPSAKLEVSTGSTSLFLVNDNVTEGNILELNKSDGDLAFSVDAITGNVAIGQTEATSKLVVDGDVFISGILTSNNLSSTARFDAIGIGTDPDTNIPIQVSTGSTSLFLVNNNTSDGNIFELNKSDGDLAFAIDSVTGNVAIGQTEATSKLIVDGDVFITGVITASNISNQSTTFENINVTETITINTGIVTNLNVSGIATINTGIVTNLSVSGFSTFSDDVNIGAGETTTAFFDVSTGNVGIGTSTNLSDKLTIIGNTKLGGANDTLSVGNSITMSAGIITALKLEGEGGTIIDISGDGTVITGIVTIGESSITLDGTNGTESIVIGSGITLSAVSVSTFTNSVDINGDLDVDGHTELDNVNVSGACTISTIKLTALGIGTAPDINTPLQISTGSTSLFLVNDNVTDGNIFELNKSDGNLAFGVDSVTGNVAIGQTEATSKLIVDGDVFITGVATATDFDSTSDARLKTNIKVIENPLKKVLQINGVSFNWIKDNKPSLGVIADNIEEILPELVSNGDFKTVKYNGLIGLLIEVVKEQQTQINSLNDRLSKLE